jgi:hypothetical protein
MAAVAIGGAAELGTTLSIVAALGVTVNRRGRRDRYQGFRGSSFISGVHTNAN